MAIITISRGSFAGGRALAEQLAERLGKPVLGREQVLAEAAQDYGIQASELTSALNESPPFWMQMPGKRLAYVKCVTAVLLKYASEGSLIYHGNVGHLLLAGVPHVLRVRVIADEEFRVESAMKQAGLTRNEALSHIRRVDEDRSRWARLLYGVDWEDPNQYGVLFNLDQISVEGACEALVRMTELEDFKPSAAGLKRLEDIRLSCEVWAALAKDPKTRSAGIDVTAEDGDILIQGSVGSTKAAELLPEIARQVEGVKSVRSEAGVGTGWYW